jgi:hypothetical protein
MGIDVHGRGGFNRPRIGSAVTDASESLSIGEFEHVAVGSSAVLLRVSGSSSHPRPAPDWRPTLVADDGTGPERFEAIASPPDAEGVLRAAYSVPAALIGSGARFWLELDDGQTAELGDPTPGAARRPAAESNDDEPDQGPTSTAALAAARENAAQLQGENETMAATLEELEIWRGELERRLADTTTELAETRARLAASHAAAKIEALVARAEADALEQAARELTEAAEQARSRD